jgi:cell wall-associated NlpC family hydrolase
MIFTLLLSIVFAGPVEQRQCVVNEARAQFGKPYVWGAIGPDEFDCSGLVMYCYEKCGYDSWEGQRKRPPA